MADPRDELTVERVIPAPPEKIFDLLADPGGPSEDRRLGRGGAAKVGGPDRLELGSTFGMGMKLGVPYSATNKVIEFEDGRRIAWQTKRRAPPARSVLADDLALRARARRGRHPGPRDLGHLAGERSRTRCARRRATIREAMEKTLESIENLVTGSG